MRAVESRVGFFVCTIFVDNHSFLSPDPNLDQDDLHDFSSKDEESESEIDNLRSSIGFIFEEEVKENDRYRRGVISELLSTEAQRELAFEVIEQLNMRRLKFTLDSILCVLRHHETPDNVFEVADIFNRGEHTPFASLFLVTNL